MKLFYQWFPLVAMMLFSAVNGCAQALPTTEAKPLPQSLEEQLVLFSLKRPAPVVDGVLDDNCWQGAQKATGLMKIGKTEAAPVATELMSCYADGVLYVAIKAHEPEMKNLVANAEQIWNGDCIEFFFAPESAAPKSFHLLVDSQANLFVIRQDGGSHQIKPNITAAAKRFDDYWSVELAIPFTDIETQMPADNLRWDLNFGRERYAGGKQELFSWAPVGVFSQREKWGKLAFYSKAEVDADLAYWRNNQADPLLRRAEVSGFDIAQKFAGVKKLPTLWKYDPFGADREKNAKWNAFGLQGGGVTGYVSAKDDYPEFYRAAMGLNRNLIAKVRLDEQIRQLRKVGFYAVPTAPDEKPLEKIVAKSTVIDNALGEIYQIYGRAFDDSWNKVELGDVDARNAAAQKQITELTQGVSKALIALQSKSKKKTNWQSTSLRIPSGQKMLNSDGASTRLSFTGMRFDGHEEVFDLLGAKWDSLDVDWPYTIPEMIAPGKYDYKTLDEQAALIKKYGKAPQVDFQTAIGSQYWMPLAPWMAEKAVTDPDIFLTSEDGLTPGTMKVAGKTLHQAMNPNNPQVQSFARDYLKNLAAHAKDETHFFVTGWEDLPIIQPLNAAGETLRRSPGYNVSNKANFREYLQQRYKTISNLNAKWRANYAAFTTIEPPTDKYITPATTASGLTYEFERWIRLNHIRYNVLQLESLKAGAPNVPVMIDDSNFLLEMTGYQMFKENAADIYSHHSNPGAEDAMWNYLNSMQRRFGKTLGFFENYWGMYRNNHLSNERLAQSDVRKFFFDLYGRDIRLSTWWLNVSNSSTDYVVAYGGGVFGVDYDQTIYRPSSAELAPMFERGRQIEKALVETAPEKPTIAIVQPDASILNYAAMGRTYHDSPSIQSMLEAHNVLLEPWDLAHDFLPEEMVLDGKAKLSEYKVLVLPPTPFISPEFARGLRGWIESGGVLIALGDLPDKDQFGNDLAANISLAKIIVTQLKTLQGDLQTATLGKGRVLLMHAPLSQILRDEKAAAALRAAICAAAPPSASTPSGDLKLLMRDGKGGKFLMLNNRNVEKPLETTVTLRGRYTAPLDVLVPGWFPVPSKIEGANTTLKIYLDPGEWTLVKLQ